MTTNKPLVLAILGVLFVAALAAAARPLVQAESQEEDEITFARRDVTTAGESWMDACIADLDGDGHQDLVAIEGFPAGTYGDDSIRWWQNDGTPADGGWTMRVIGDDIPGGKAVHVADLDGDGDLDVLTAASVVDHGETAWWENDGTPENGGWIRHPIDGLGAADVTAADLDDDSDLDVIVAVVVPSPGFSVWWENDGTPADGSWEPHIIPDDAADVYAVAAADLNDDTHLDIVGALPGDYMTGDGRIVWWESDGTPDDGWISHVLATDFASASDVHVTDLDGDDDPDVLAVGTQMEEFTWWENNGSGSFVQHSLTGDFTNAYRISAGDVDGDGDTDVLAASPSSGLAWWENDGHETFTRFAIDDTTNGWVSVDAADINEDEDLDLLTANFSGGYVTWWEQGGYVAPSPYYVPVVFNAFAPAATPIPTTEPPCPEFRAGQWDGDASFVVPSDRTRVLDFTLQVETTVCGSYELTAPEIDIVDCGIEYAATVGSTTVWGEASFVSETEMEGVTRVLIGSTMCFDYPQSSWISSLAGE